MTQAIHGDVSASDTALVARVLKDRDGARFRRLVERHADAVFRLALSVVRDRQDAEDATQETFSSQCGTWAGSGLGSRRERAVV